MVRINNPNRINLPSPRPHQRLFSPSLIHIFATGSAVRAALFFGDGLHSATVGKFKLRHRQSWSNILEFSLTFLLRLIFK